MPSSSVMAIIPARGGSKGVPRKNLVQIAGRPLIAWTIEAALNCSAVTETWVSTEDDEIADVARALGAGVIARPSELAGDRSSSSDVVRHALLARRDMAAPAPEIFALLQPTSPLRTARHLDDALALFRGEVRSVISVCPVDHHPLKMLIETANGRLVPVGEPEDLERPRQALPPAFRQNGAIYVMRAEDFLAGEGGFLVQPMAPYRMPVRDSIDIDTLADVEAAASLLNVCG